MRVRALLCLFGLLSLLWFLIDPTTAPGTPIRTPESPEISSRPDTSASPEPRPAIPEAAIAAAPAATFPEDPEPSLLPAKADQGAPGDAGFDPRFVQPATRMKMFGADEEEVQRDIDALTRRNDREKAAAIAWAKANGWPVKGTKDDGGDYELMRIDPDGDPIYYETQNTEARISHNVDLLTQFGGSGSVNLSGYGWTVGMWESGPPRLSHQEFNDFPNRVVYAEASSSNDSDNAQTDHGTHVMGTILGNGFVNPDVRGMAWRASAKCFGWNNDHAEMTSIGASSPNQPSRIYVSNHSYGVLGGWMKYPSDHATRAGQWYWAGADGADEDEKFGRYGSSAREIDKTCRQRPYYLPFFAAGNERGHSPSFLDTIYWNAPDGNGGYEEVSGTWGFAPSAPDADGGADGYDCLIDNGSSKNAMVVGNMEDAVSDGTRSTSGVDMVDSSSFGPTDDGRIKPDVVGNGYDVLSATKSGDTATGRKTGTSMATPGASGTALLLHEHYRDTTGQYLRGSTLKALMIHTATDILTPGPDYQSGWGLIDASAAVDQLDLHASEPGGYHLVEEVLTRDDPEFRMTFEANDLVKATLVWTDPEGSVQSGLNNRTKVLVNDLDLTIRTPAGTLYRAPSLDPLDPDASATNNGNSTDNVEMVGGLPWLVPFMPGTYEVAVTHKGDINEPGLTTSSVQPFSLILSGNAADSSGTVAEAVDKPDRTIVKHSGADTSFAWVEDASAQDGDRAENLDIDDLETAGFETTVTGPVTITFDWGVSSEDGFDFLRFYSDGVVQNEISGNVGPTSVAYNVPAGEHTLRWAYEKDVSVSEGSDSGWVDNLEFNNLPEAVDLLGLTFTEPVGSSAPWQLEDVTGTSSVPTNDIAKAGDIGALQRSDMETIIQGPALVRFRMVQTGTAGELRAQWGPALAKNVVHDAGNTFKTYSIELDAGPQTVRWSWYKPVDGSGHGRVDELTVIPVPGSLRDAFDLPFDASNLVVEDFTVAPWLADDSDAAPAGTLGEPGPSAIRTIYTPANGSLNDTAIIYPFFSNGGVVSFWWQATGAPGGNLSLQVRHDATDPFVPAGPSVGPRRIDPIPGGTPWQQVHFEVPPGYTELRFFYDADSLYEGQAWLDQLVVQEGLMHPGRGLDRWGSRWETYGDAEWAAVFDETNQGIDSTSHAPLGNDESTTLATTVVGPKKLFFDWKVSSEANFDELRFTIDGIDAVPPISGDLDWQSVSLDIPAGTHILRWIYEKDGSWSDFQDRGWVDHVALLRSDFGLGTPNPQLASNFVVIPVRKDPTAGFFIETSVDGVHWTTTGGGDGMISPRFENVSVIVPANGPSALYRLRFKPEIVHGLENAGFESPAAAPGTFFGNGPGWGPDNDGGTTTSFEHISGFADEGLQHLSIAAGAFSETKGSFLGHRGVHSVSAAIGNRSGFTQPGNVSSIVLKSGIELGRVELGAAVLDPGSWFTPLPASYDSFETDLDASYGYQIRLGSEGNRSFFDHVRAVSEPQ